MNRRKTIPFVISILLLAGLASAHRAGTLVTPQGDAPKAEPKPSASAPSKEKPKPPKEQPKKPPPDEGGW
jgi:hypothetical protein